MITTISLHPFTFLYVYIDWPTESFKDIIMRTTVYMKMIIITWYAIICCKNIILQLINVAAFHKYYCWWLYFSITFCTQLSFFINTKHCFKLYFITSNREESPNCNLLLPHNRWLIEKTYFPFSTMGEHFFFFFYIQTDRDKVWTSYVVSVQAKYCIS